MAKRHLVFFSVLVLLFMMGGFLAQEGSGLVVELTLEDLTETAEEILLGEVVELSSRWNAERTKIFTYVTISVKEYIKGASNEKKLTIEVPGGEVGDMALWVSDTPEFREGETVLLFLRPEYFQVVGWYQGKYTIEEDIIIENGVPVEEFVTQVKEILENQR